MFFLHKYMETVSLSLSQLILNGLKRMGQNNHYGYFVEQMSFVLLSQWYNSLVLYMPLSLPYITLKTFVRHMSMYVKETFSRKCHFFLPILSSHILFQTLTNFAARIINGTHLTFIVLGTYERILSFPSKTFFSNRNFLQSVNSSCNR